MTKKLVHVGFIADGNRRWAKAHNIPTLEGHRRGAEVAEMIVDYLNEKTDIKFVSFYVFSTENWSRTPEEISYLMKMAGDSVTKFSKKAVKENLRIILLGRPEKVDPALWQKLQEVEEKTKDNTGLTVCFCFNYGGHWEIVDAAKKAIANGATIETPEDFRAFLYHPEVPDVDLVVRTSGESRSSGFMLWRTAYAEYSFLQKFFPEFNEEDLANVIEEYQNRERRFGK